MTLIKWSGPSAMAILTACVTWMTSNSALAQWGSIRGNNRDHDEHGRQEVRHEERGREVHVEPQRGRETAREVHRAPVVVERPHWDWDADHRQGYYWSGYHAGMRLRTLPPGYASVVLGGQPYYYYEGVYYQGGPADYSVVAPPPGAIIPVLPPGAQAVPVGGSVYYYAGGAFYVQQPNGFAVVPPPLGVTVPALPPGAVPVTINGMVYYTANSVYYMPVMQGGITMYTVVQP